MATFSQRKGLVPVNKLIQVDSMDEVLRTVLWNALDRALWSNRQFMSENGPYAGSMHEFSLNLWEVFFVKRSDSRPGLAEWQLNEIRTWYFKAPWNRVYDFLEFILSEESGIDTEDLGDWLNLALAKGGSGYRIVDGLVTDIVSENEVSMLQETLEAEAGGPVRLHLRRALELLSDRDNPDYRNSIKESISAVESMAKIVADNPKATLAGALKALEKNGQMHSALKEGFLKLYGYTNDENGIRHAMMDEPNLTSADAKYFLMSCTSFVNYIKANQPA